MKKTALLLLVLVFVLSPAVGAQKIFNYGIESGPTSLDPAILYGNNSIQLAQNLFDGLTSINDNLDIIPSIAKDWTASDDGLTYTFYLREDVYFTNGDQVTAEDFKYSWNRALDPELGNPHLFMMDLIKGARSVIAGETTEAEGLVVKDEFVFEVTLEYPAGHFLSLSSSFPYWVVNKNVIEEYGDDWTRPGNIVGTGAFILTEAVMDNYFVFEANKDYFKGAPDIDVARAHIIPEATIRMMKYEAGELDAIISLTPADLMRIKADDSLSEQFGSISGLATRWLGIRTTKEPFDDIRVRQAFAMAIDRERLVQIALNNMGQAAYTFLPIGMPGYNPDLRPYDFNPEKAQQLLEEAGFPLGSGFPAVKIYFDSTDEMQRVWQFVQSEIRRNLGIVNIGLESLPWRGYVTVRNNPDTRPALFRNGMGADYPDPQEFLEYFGVSDSFHNFEEYNDPRFDQLIYQANRTLDFDERMELFGQAEAMYLESAALIPLYHPLSTWMQKPHVDGFGYSPLYLKPLHSVTLK